MSSILRGFRVPGKGAGCFESDFDFEPNCIQSTNLKATFRGKRVLVRIVQLRQFWN